MIRFVVPIILLLISTNVAITQTDSIGVFLQRDENSPFTGPKKYMWVDMKNIVTSTQVGVGKLLKVYTNNGRADQPAYYTADQCAITPLVEGDVTVMAVQRVLVGGIWDTVTTVSSFTAIEQPEIRLMVLEDSLREACKLEFFLADKYKFRPLDNSYAVANTFEPLVFDKDNELVGKLPKSRGTVIDCSVTNLPFKIEKGYRIVFQVMVRDMQTDLLVPADEWVHIVE